MNTDVAVASQHSAPSNSEKPDQNLNSAHAPDAKQQNVSPSPERNDNDENIQQKRKMTKKANAEIVYKKRKLSNDTKKFTCKFSSYSASYASHLITQTRIHTDGKPCEGEAHAMNSTQKKDLKDHMKTDANRFPFQCSICQQGFHIQREWKLHEKSCKRRRYECYLCQYTCLKKSHLVQHMPKHTGAKSFQCSKCQ